LFLLSQNSAKSQFAFLGDCSKFST
jgi:hypothetical protein